MFEQFTEPAIANFNQTMCLKFPFCSRERLYGLIYKGEVFEQMVQHPTVMAIAEAILGVDMTLSGFSAHILQPGASCMGYPYFSLPQPYPASPVLEIQAIWMLEDFIETNGAPMFAPGSQAFCHFPDPAKFQLLAKIVMGKAGSVVLSHGLCWHDTLPNTSQQPRVSVLGNYNPKIIRPLEDLTKGQQSAFMNRATLTLKQLLGYDVLRALLNDVTKLRSH
ncbi:phytanoyl-CoA dioxygenase family protein [Leptolyngbyaceae cyanobacterium UHCC 1019]